MIYIYIYIYIYIFIYLIQKLLSSGTVSTSKLFSKYPAFKSLPRGHKSAWRCRFSLLLRVNVETLVLFEIIMWPTPATYFPVHSSLINVPFNAIHCVAHNLDKWIINKTKTDKQNYVSFLQGLLHLTLFEVMHRAPTDEVSYFQGFPVTCQIPGSARDILAPPAG